MPASQSLRGSAGSFISAGRRRIAAIIPSSAAPPVSRITGTSSSGMWGMTTAGRSAAAPLPTPSGPRVFTNFVQPTYPPAPTMPSISRPPMNRSGECLCTRRGGEGRERGSGRSGRAGRSISRPTMAGEGARRGGGAPASSSSGATSKRMKSGSSSGAGPVCSSQAGGPSEVNTESGGSRSRPSSGAAAGEKSITPASAGSDASSGAAEGCSAWKAAGSRSSASRPVRSTVLPASAASPSPPPASPAGAASASGPASRDGFAGGAV